MKQKLSLLLLLIFAALTTTFAQDDKDATFRSSLKKEKDEPRSFKDRLWYGGGINLGFGGGSSASVFQFGLSPMVGYKLFGPVSLGPRAELNFSSVKYPNARALNFVDSEIGLFLRVRIFRGLFIQGEAVNQWYHIPYFGNPPFTEKDQRFNQRIGLGWNYGNGGAGSEIGIFYDFANAQESSFYNPFIPRFNLTWKY